MKPLSDLESVPSRSYTLLSKNPRPDPTITSRSVEVIRQEKLVQDGSTISSAGKSLLNSSLTQSRPSSTITSPSAGTSLLNSSVTQKVNDNSPPMGASLFSSLNQTMNRPKIVYVSSSMKNQPALATLINNETIQKIVGEKYSVKEEQIDNSTSAKLHESNEQSIVESKVKEDDLNTDDLDKNKIIELPFTIHSAVSGENEEGENLVTKTEPVEAAESMESEAGIGMITNEITSPQSTAKPEIMMSSEMNVAVSTSDQLIALAEDIAPTADGIASDTGNIVPTAEGMVPDPGNVASDKKVVGPESEATTLDDHQILITQNDQLMSGPDQLVTGQQEGHLMTSEPLITSAGQLTMENQQGNSVANSGHLVLEDKPVEDQLVTEDEGMEIGQHMTDANQVIVIEDGQMISAVEGQIMVHNGQFMQVQGGGLVPVAFDSQEEQQASAETAPVDSAEPTSVDPSQLLLQDDGNGIQDGQAFETEAGLFLVRNADGTFQIHQSEGGLLL